MTIVRRRYKLTIAYDGTEFHGWQKQRPPDGPELRTVAGVVESAMFRVLQQPVELVGASRTDAGVHARGQVAHLDAATPIPVERLPHAINSRLPPDVDVTDACVVAADFHAIRGARSKEYRYRICTGTHRPVHRRNHVWHCWWPLHVDAMNDAASRLVGTHDVGGFAAAGHGRTTTVRTIHACRVEHEEPGHARPDLCIVVCGDGFLYNTVRIIAGTLVEVGRGRFEPRVVDRVLVTQDRRQAGPTLPPQGLWLEKIEY